MSDIIEGGCPNKDCILADCQFQISAESKYCPACGTQLVPYEAFMQHLSEEAAIAGLPSNDDPPSEPPCDDGLRVKSTP